MSITKASGTFNQKRLSVIEENYIEKTYVSKNVKLSDEEFEKSPEKKKTQVKTNFVQNLTRLNLINLFIKHLKQVSGKYGRLGARQLKIINDVSTEESYSTIVQNEKSDVDYHNIFVKLIVMKLKKN